MIKVIPAVILAVALAILAIYYVIDRREYPAFKLIVEGDRRRRYFKRWIGRSFLAFGVYALIALWMLSQENAVFDMPPKFAVLTNGLIGWTGQLHLGFDFVIGFLGSFLVGTMAATFLVLRRGSKPVSLGDIDALLPRDGREMGWATLLSLNAGFSEELFFRLMLPLTLVTMIGDPLTSFIFSAILFGLVHSYQGWLGVFAATVLGAILTLVYLASRSIVLAMIIHALIDLNGLVLQPWLRTRLRGSKP